DSNFGGATTLLVGTTRAGGIGRALLKFDIGAAVPKNALVKSVTLTLMDVSNSSKFNPSTFSLHRLLANWSEGTKISGQESQNKGEAPWTDGLFGDQPWTEPGAAAPKDYIAKASASLAMPTGGKTNVWQSPPELVADVQAWLSNPATNFG